MDNTIDNTVRNAIQRLQERYLHALDGKDMQSWLACFSQDGSYYAIGADNADDDLPICLMMDDCYERLQDRVTFVTEVWIGAFEDYQTRHFIQPLDLQLGDDGLYTASTNVSILTTNSQGLTSLFIAGRYEDQIRIENSEALFKERKMIMDTFTTPGVVVYPL